MEEFHNSMPRRSVDLIKVQEDATNYKLYDVGVQCCCVFIGMYLKYVVVFFIGMYLIFIYKQLYVGMIYRNKMA